MIKCRGLRKSAQMTLDNETTGKDLGGRRPTFTDSHNRNALRLIESGELASQVARDLRISRTTIYRRIRELPTSSMKGS